MNILEKKMVDVLKDLKDNYYVNGIKAEFEAEGTRLEEALRLKEVCMKAELPLTIKIGGCEAVRDLYECRVIGVNRIVAPMVETVTAMKKFIAAAKLAIPEDERKSIALAINVETVDSCNAFDKMLHTKEINELNGIVVGRTDMTRSLNLSINDINTDTIFEYTKTVFAKAKTRGLICACGGGVSAHSLPFFRRLPECFLDYYETRKVIFGCPGALRDGAETGILKAVGFELLWLKNKRDYYTAISIEDNHRIKTLESRYKDSIVEVGGKVE